MKVNIPANTIEMVHIYGKQIAPVCGGAAAKSFKKRTTTQHFTNSDIRQLAQLYLNGVMAEVDAA